MNKKDVQNLRLAIHSLKGADEFIELCEQMITLVDKRGEDGAWRLLKGSNYIFAVDPGYGFTTAATLFQSLIVSLFDNDDKSIENGNKPVFELLSTRNKISFRLVEWKEMIAEKEPNKYEAILKRELDKNDKVSLIFHVDEFGANEKNEDEALIKKYTSAITVHFKKPTEEEFIELCKAEAISSFPGENVPEAAIRKELQRMRETAAFRGTASKEILVSNVVAGLALGSYKDVGEASAAEQFQLLSKKYQRISDILKQTVKGQDNVISEVVQGLFAGELDASKKRHNPRAAFLFAGSPGVGKTLLAKTLAKTLELPCLTLCMSDYADEKSYIDLVGASTKFRGASEGTLTKFARENPYSIIIFDEIEKAHLTSIHLLLQVLDMGILYDPYFDKDIDFTNTITIFTTNAGKSIYEDPRNKNLSLLPKRVIANALETEKRPDRDECFFPQAICSRMVSGNLLMFNRMDTSVLMEISSANIKATGSEFYENYDFSVELEEAVSALFLYHEGNALDARVASKKSVQFVRDELYELARLVTDHADFLKNISKLSFTVNKDEDDDLLELLNPKCEEGKILFVGKRFAQMEKLGDIFVCVDQEEELEGVLESQLFSCILIDPYLGYHEPKREKLCINDMESVGMSIFHSLVEKAVEEPIYILDRACDFTKIERESFILDGATDCVFAYKDFDIFKQSITKLLKDISITKAHEEFCNRGYVVEYSSRQIKEGSQLTIEFYNLKKKMVPDAESAKMMVAATERPKTRFSDVLGAKEAKEELSYFTDYFTKPKFTRIAGSRAPKGLLFYGPPGTGKTMLARAFAGETDAEFISTSASELLNAQMGKGEEKIRQLFATAHRYAPAIIFIDEIDAIGQVRRGGAGDSLLNALLTEMDGFNTYPGKPVFVLAATNFGVIGDSAKSLQLDPALLRRFDNQIFVDNPKEPEREEFFTRWKEKNSSASYSNETITNLAKRSIGKSIAELENVMQLAVRNASKKEGKITDEILLDAFEQLQYGVKKEYNEASYRSTAIHEAGHAYIAHLSGSTPAYITITGRANFLGYVMPMIDEDKGTYSEKELRWKIRELLAGRMAEKVLIGEEESLNTGAGSDLEKATHYAIAMVTKYAFVKDQMITLSDSYINQFGIPQEYLKLANEIILEEQRKCEELINEGKEKLLCLVEKVLKNNYLTTEQMKEIFEK